MKTTPKLCTVCGELKPREEFHKAGSGVQGACKLCVVERVKQWRENNPGCRARQWKMTGCESAKRWKASLTKEQLSAYYRRADLKKKYGVTIEWYEAAFEAQGGVCAICECPPDGKNLAVDHCHTSGKNRGLLCSKCNVALERMESIPEWHEKAIRYLTRFALAKMEKEFK